MHFVERHIHSKTIVVSHICVWNELKTRWQKDEGMFMKMIYTQKQQKLQTQNTWRKRDRFSTSFLFSLHCFQSLSTHKNLFKLERAKDNTMSNALQMMPFCLPFQICVFFFSNPCPIRCGIYATYFYAISTVTYQKISYMTKVSCIFWNCLQCSESFPDTND